MEAVAGRRSDWPITRRLALAACLLILVVAIAGAIKVNAALGLKPGPNEYNVAAWEARHFANKWLFAFGRWFRNEPSLEEQDATLRRFFALTGEIEALERSISDAGRRGVAVDEAALRRLESAQRERDRIENRVEAIVEERITRVAAAEGITRSLLLLRGVVWPPIDFEFTRAPHSLAVSPRDRIELKDTDLLREDLDLEQIERIEAERERREDVSALAFPTGGVGAYPSIVDYAGDYRRLLEVVAHEWTHHYLFFSPLGFNYYDNYELRSMNETVADLAGREIAEAVIRGWPLDDASARPSSAPERDRGLDVGAELRRLRAEVDALLATGGIEAAEALMERRRQELAEQGVLIRKINQAYFAFTNLYAGEAGNPAATNPIGPKIDELRRRSASLRAFLNTISSITSVEELDRVLGTGE